MVWPALVIGLVLAVWAIVAIAYRRELAAAWREPVLKHAVLILESDDWGPGPESDAERLRALLDVLRRHRDRTGRPAVSTIGVLLGIVDTATAPASRFADYNRVRLDDIRFRPILDVLRQGRSEGVLSLQLHGMEHYWPAAVLAAAASGDEAVRGWLQSPGVPRHEDLPPYLQARWTDASTLPSRQLTRGETQAAVTEEIAAFAATVGQPPEVVVPPTFVWSAETESAWAAGGIRVVVTPGRRWVSHDTQGSLVADLSDIHNADFSPCGLMYIVRDDYFEPGRGHRAEDALNALAIKTAAGRPTLLEMHRSNFTEDQEIARTALRELDRLLSMAIAQFPELQFVSTGELASAMLEHEPDLIERSFKHRASVWLTRVGALSRLRKLTWATGLIIPVGMMWALTRSASSANALADTAP